MPTFDLTPRGRAFADACFAQNSIPELQEALSRRSADRTDCAEWRIAPSEWRRAIRTALEELNAAREARSAAARTLGARGGAARTPAQAAAGRRNGAKGGRPRLVVTYREAYRDNVTWQLCREHAADDAREGRAALGIGPLGPVTHGAHRGDCDVCEARP